jgi:type I restriction enzyme M protein
MSSNSSGEGDIRRTLIEADLVETATRECAPLKSEGIPQVVSATRDNRVALSGQLFTNTQIPSCIWFLTKNKAKRSRPGVSALRDRRGETHFIDARKLGFMKDRVLRDFAPEDIQKKAGAFREWRIESYEGVSGFCKSSIIQGIPNHGYVHTSGRFVGVEDIRDVVLLYLLNGKLNNSI